MDEKIQKAISLYPHLVNVVLVLAFYMKNNALYLIGINVILLVVLVLGRTKGKLMRVQFVKLSLINLILLIWLLVYLASIYNKEPFFLLKTENVSRISGRLTKDTTYTKTGKTFAVVRLKEVYDDKKGIASSADGIVNVLVTHTNKEGLSGEKVEFAVSKYQDGLFFASSMILPESRNIAKKCRFAILGDMKNRLMHIEHSKNSEVSWYARRLASLLLFADSLDEEFPLKTKGASLGLAHIFALSGMHLNLIAASLTFLLSFVFPKRKAKFIILPLLGAYTFLVGSSASLIRAFLMRAVATVFPFLSQYALFLSLIIQTLLFKESVLTVSFAFSFISTASLITAFSFFRFVLSSVFSNKLSFLLSGGVSALVFSSPLSISLFGTWSLGGVFLTSISTILVSTNMIGGVLLLLFKHSFLASFLLDSSYFLFDKMMDVSLYVFKTHSVVGFLVFLTVLIFFALLKALIYRKIKKSVL